jgi:hypothetical protein
MFAVVLAYFGLLAAFTGVISLVRPIALLGIPTRSRAAAVVAAGLFVTLAALLLPARKTVTASSRTALDRIAPAYQFREVHSVTIRAPPERIYRAIKTLPAGEILFFRTLVWLRRSGRHGPESILNPPDRQPLLDVATRTGFITLADGPQEIVIGTVVVAPPAGVRRRTLTVDEFLALRAKAGFALAAINFVITPQDGGTCLVSTETRVYATDASARRRFAAYWRIIYPGSALIRRMWLRAIRLRAEAG